MACFVNEVATLTKDSRFGVGFVLRKREKPGFPQLGSRGAVVSSHAGASAARHGDARHVGDSARDACLSGSRRRGRGGRKWGFVFLQK